MTVLVNNNAGSKLSAGIDASQTSLAITSGDGALFPSPSVGSYYYGTLSEGTVFEIVKVTGRTGDSFAIERGQDGTSGHSFTVAAKFEQRWNRSQIQEKIQDHAWPKVVSIPNSTNLISITFASQRPDENYSVPFSFECNDVNPIFLQGMIQNKTVNGFDIVMNALTDSANYKLNYTIGNTL